MRRGLKIAARPSAGDIVQFVKLREQKARINSLSRNSAAALTALTSSMLGNHTLKTCDSSQL